MTVNDLSTARELMDEIGSSAVGYAYRRKTGQTLYAVFTSESSNDLDSSPEVVPFVPIQSDSNHDDHVHILDVSLGHYTSHIFRHDMDFYLNPNGDSSNLNTKAERK